MATSCTVAFVEKRKMRAVVFLPIIAWVLLSLLWTGSWYLRMHNALSAPRNYRRPAEYVYRRAMIEAEERSLRDFQHFFTEWGPAQKRTLLLAIFVWSFFWPPILVAGAKRLWIVRGFGLYTRRIRGADIHSLTLLWIPAFKRNKVILMTESGDVFEFWQFFKTRRIAETLSALYGVKIHPQTALGSLSRGSIWTHG